MKDQTQYMPGSHEGWLAKTGGYAKDMTLRDYFASKAMQGLLPGLDLAMPAEKVAEWTYEYADAMLEARNAAQ